MGTRAGLKRVFWIGAAGLLGLAALDAIVAIVRGGFTETDGEILATLGMLFLCGSCAIAGTALLDRAQVAPLAWGAIATAVASFPVVASFIWRDFEDETHGRFAGTALVLVGAAILFTTGRLLLHSERLRRLWFAQIALFGLVGAILLGFIWTDDGSEELGKLAAAAAILGSLAWFLVPVLQRLQGVSVSEVPQAGAIPHLSGGGVELVVAPADGPFRIAAEGGALVVTHDGTRTRLPAGSSLVVRRAP